MLECRWWRCARGGRSHAPRGSNHMRSSIHHKGHKGHEGEHLPSLSLVLVRSSRPGLCVLRVLCGGFALPYFTTTLTSGPFATTTLTIVLRAVCCLMVSSARASSLSSPSDSPARTVR